MALVVYGRKQSQGRATVHAVRLLRAVRGGGESRRLITDGVYGRTHAPGLWKSLGGTSEQPGLFQEHFQEHLAATR